MAGKEPRINTQTLILYEELSAPDLAKNNTKQLGSKRAINSVTVKVIAV